MFADIINAFGLSAIALAGLSYLFQRRRDLRLKETDYKETRYKCILMLMYAYLTKDMRDIGKYNSAIVSHSTLKKELAAEWVNCWLYSSDDTVRGLKEFIEEPSENGFANVVLRMRKELWNVKTKLQAGEFKLPE